MLEPQPLKRLKKKYEVPTIDPAMVPAFSVVHERLIDVDDDEPDQREGRVRRKRLLRPDVRLGNSEA